MFKKLMVLFGILSLLETAHGQSTIDNVCSSAGVLNDPVLFNCDFSDTAGMPGMEVDLYYKGQNDISFNEITMNFLDLPPYYPYLYKTGVNFVQDPGILEYYIRASSDSFMTTQSPKNVSNQFPPDLIGFAHFRTDPQGDTSNGSLGSWLDLTGSGMTYSDSRIFGYLENVSATWPLNQGLSFFIYGLGFYVPSGTDTVFYAMVHVDVFSIITSGLFKLDPVDSSYTRIGDIDYSINEGYLHMASDISDYANDPAWPGWPPPNGYLTCMGLSGTVGLSDTAYNDMTELTQFEPETQYLNFSINNPPQLDSSHFETIPDTSLTLRIAYGDNDNNLPTIRKLIFNSTEFDMGSFDHVYSDTAEFEVVLAWPGEGWHYFDFLFSDGADTIATSLDSLQISSGCDYVLGDVNGSNSFNGLDITYGVAYFKGGPDPLCDSCDCPPNPFFWVCGDINASCSYNGLDITYGVAYFKGGLSPIPCADCPPGGDGIINVKAKLLR